MNKQNMLRLADYLEAQPDERFDMEYYVDFEEGPLSLTNPAPEVVVLEARDGRIPHCGTTDCIAGHVVLGFPSEVDASDRIRMDRGRFASTYFHIGAKFLGLDYDEAINLFLWFDASREDAVATLRASVEAGEIVRTRA